jgi:hypothetical protein
MSERQTEIEKLEINLANLADALDIRDQTVREYAKFNVLRIAYEAVDKTSTLGVAIKREIKETMERLDDLKNRIPPEYMEGLD